MGRLEITMLSWDAQTEAVEAETRQALCKPHEIVHDNNTPRVAFHPEVG